MSYSPSGSRSPSEWVCPRGAPPMNLPGSLQEVPKVGKQLEGPLSGVPLRLSSDSRGGLVSSINILLGQKCGTRGFD